MEEIIANVSCSLTGRVLLFLSTAMQRQAAGPLRSDPPKFLSATVPPNEAKDRVSLFADAVPHARTNLIPGNGRGRLA